MKLQANKQMNNMWDKTNRWKNLVGWVTTPFKTLNEKENVRTGSNHAMCSFSWQTKYTLLSRGNFQTNLHYTHFYFFTFMGFGVCIRNFKYFCINLYSYLKCHFIFMFWLFGNIGKRGTYYSEQQCINLQKSSMYCFSKIKT